MSRHFLGVFLTMAASTTVVAQAPSFSSRVEAVRVDVLVTENGRLVSGLAPGDFEVLDNGVPQKVDLASLEEIPLNVVLALDVSGSLNAQQIGHLQTAGSTLLDGLKQTDQAALLTFSHVVSQGSPLTSDFNRIRAALKETGTSGQTSLVDAAYAGMMIGESDVGRSLLIVFTDGVDTRSWLTADAVLETAKRCDVVVYGVDVGTRRASFSRELSAATGGRLVEIESTRDLNATFRGILDEFRQRYLISYSPEGVTPGGWHRLDVRVKARSVTVRARPGYLSSH
ncbi:MAG: VWA domain-containing protein [Vicinamibacterales bacterium]|nr:VWA domain-containing protein [Vicinamibacterales bacterium]